MRKIKIGINGFGRIGRLVFRAAQQRDDIVVVGINDLIDVEYMAYMLKYDSMHGRFDGTVKIKDGMLVVNGKKIRVTAEKDPANLKWGEIGAEYVVESTGLFLTREKSEAAKRALIAEVEAFEPLESRDETAAALKAFQARWNEIGFVPFKEKDRVQHAFKTALDAQFDRMRGEIRTTRREAAVKDPVRSEREKLVQEYLQKEQEIATWSNNMGFFAKSKNADALLADMDKKIEAAKEELAALEARIKEFETTKALINASKKLKVKVAVTLTNLAIERVEAKIDYNLSQEKVKLDLGDLTGAFGDKLEVTMDLYNPSLKFDLTTNLGVPATVQATLVPWKNNAPNTQNQIQVNLDVNPAPSATQTSTMKYFLAAHNEGRPADYTYVAADIASLIKLMPDSVLVTLNAATVPTQTAVVEPAAAYNFNVNYEVGGWIPSAGRWASPTWSVRDC